MVSTQLSNCYWICEPQNNMEMNIQCDIVIEERKPDIVIANKMEKTAIIIDVAIPGDKRII